VVRESALPTRGGGLILGRSPSSSRVLAHAVVKIPTLVNTDSVGAGAGVPNVRLHMWGIRLTEDRPKVELTRCPGVLIE
jgi:hypothetical protein